MKVLDRSPQFWRFWEERCRVNRAFVPEYSEYYLGKFEIDAYDSHSLHVGIFQQEEGQEKELGFARITYNTANDPVVENRLPNEIAKVVEEVYSDPSVSPLPLWENYHLSEQALNAFPFYQGGIPMKTAEIGRLMILEKNSSVRLATHFITYILALTKYLGIDVALASQTQAHYKFYARYFAISHAWDPPYKHGDEMCISVFDLHRRLRNKQDLMDHMIQEFRHKGFSHPIQFESHELLRSSLLKPQH